MIFMTHTYLHLIESTVAKYSHALQEVHVSLHTQHTPHIEKLGFRIMAAYSYSYKGVDYEFVDTLIELLEELKCAICLELVSDPVQTSCGHLFCGKCIKRTNTCPIDRKQFTSHPDNFNDRRVRNFKVKCPKEGRGCQWQGELGDADKHTNTNCDYQMVKCDNERCNVKVERRQLTRHRQSGCLHRMYKCPHCSDSKEDTYLEVTTTHFTTCENMPLPCPSGCGTHGLVRRDIAHHLSEDCPDELVSCALAIAGCQQIVKRKDRQQHLQDKDLHLRTVVSSHMSLNVFVQDMLHGSTSNIPFLLCHWLQNTPTCYPRPPWVIKMEKFQEKKEKSCRLFSDPVYSHFGGYKMCLRVDVNGRGDGKGTHVSVYAYLMRGDNDNNLKWPFKGTIKVSLLNQLEDGQHHTERLWTPDCTVPEVAERRVMEGERAANGFGKRQFIPHLDLACNDENHCQYLKDDILFLRVDCFEPKLD